MAPLTLVYSTQGSNFSGKRVDDGLSLSHVPSLELIILFKGRDNVFGLVILAFVCVCVCVCVCLCVCVCVDQVSVIQITQNRFLMGKFC